jgi:hypothetical protein
MLFFSFAFLPYDVSPKKEQKTGQHLVRNGRNVVFVQERGDGNLTNVVNSRVFSITASLVCT